MKDQKSLKSTRGHRNARIKNVVVKRKTRIKLKKIHRFHYLMGLVIFVVVFGAIGGTIIYISHADNTAAAVEGIDNKCLDNANGAAINSNKIELDTCNGSNAQKWTINGSDSISGTIVNENGFCLGVADGDTANGTVAILYNCDGHSSQQWFYNSTSDFIINANSDTCLDDLNSVTTNGNQIDIHTCNATTAQKWRYAGLAPTPPPPSCPPGDSGTYPNCVAPTCPKGDTGTYPNCVAPTCPKGDTGTYPNCVAPTCPKGDTGTYPNCVGPTPTPPPPTGSSPPPSGSGSLTVGSQPGGSSGGSLTVGSQPGGSLSVGSGSLYSGSGSGSYSSSSTGSGSGSGPSVSVLSTGSSKLPSTPNKVPVISDLKISHITASSAVISWKINTRTDYTLRYGTNKSHLSISRSFSSTKATVTLTLRYLPSGKQIFVSITPKNNKLSGKSKTLAFKTATKSNIVPIIVGIIVFGLIAFIFYRIIMFGVNKKPKEREEEAVDLTTVFPKEDAADYNSRVNWWQTPNSADTGTTIRPHKKKDDDIPDMFEEGRARLDEEERQKRKL